MNKSSLKETLLVLGVSGALLLGCATVKSALRFIDDIAKDLCMLAATEQQETDASALDGLTPAQWCAIKENLDPFIQEALKAKNAASGLSGLSQP